MEIHETAVSFGASGTLVGIVTQPPEGAASPIGCLLLNTGVNHRIGPRRINVKAARAMAQAGLPSLRFDLSGIGDSLASTGQADFRHQALLDMRAALNQLQASTGVRQFVVFGICSGAENGLALALDDPRIVGLAMFDGYTFLSKRVRIERKLRRWAAFPFNRSLRRQFPAWMDWTAWASAPGDAQARQRALGRVFGRLAPKTTQESGIFAADAPPYHAADFERDMDKLVDRGVEVYVMFSTTITSVDHHRDMLSGVQGGRFMERTRYRFWSDIDHTITPVTAQRKLLDSLCDWATEIVRARTSSADARDAHRTGAAPEQLRAARA